MPGRSFGLLITFAAAFAAHPAGAADASRAAAVAIIIDDIGYRHRSDQDAIALPGPLAVAILPHSPHAAEMSRLAHASGKDVLVHLPMEATEARHNRFLGPGALTSTMGRAEFMHTLSDDLQSVPGASGVSNHMGSLLTRMPEQMGWLMEGLQVGNKFYVDSVTSHRSVAGDVALKHRLPHLRRDVFLDNEQDTAHIERQLEYLVSVARRRGSALAIGHPYPETIETLRRWLPAMQAAGVELVSVVMLVSPSGMAAMPLPAALPKTAPASASFR